MEKKLNVPDRLYFRIGDVAELIGVKPYVLRYWESEFSMIRPQKSTSGHRVYRRSDVETVWMIKRLLYEERYSLEGAKKKMKEFKKEENSTDLKNNSVATLLHFHPEVSSSDPGPEHKESFTQELEEIQHLAYELENLAKIKISDLFEY